MAPRAFGMFLTAVLTIGGVHSPVHAVTLNELTCESPSQDWQWLLDTFSVSPQLAKSQDGMRASNLIRTCKNQLEQRGIAACFTNLDRFAENASLISKFDHTFGFRLSDDEYIASRPKEVISLPAELANGLPANYEEVAAAQGWQVLKYRSRIVANPPNSMVSRVLFFVPGERVDRWIQFTANDFNPTQPDRLVDFIGVQKVDLATPEAAPLAKPKIHFMQYWRDLAGQNPVPRGNYDRCFTCHPSGMRQLVPDESTLSTVQRQLASSFNKTMKLYGEMDFDGAVQPEAFGPPMGEKIGCTTCHEGFNQVNSFSRGALTWYNNSDHIRHKMVNELTMPLAVRSKMKPLFEIFKEVGEFGDAERSLLTSSTKTGDYGSILSALYSQGKIDQQKYSEVSTLVSGAQTKQMQDYSDMLSDYRGTLKTWLGGREENCALK